MSGNDTATRPAAAKTDRRIVRTRDTLGDALVQLIREKPFDEITVQQILDRAGVGRSTFYTHYRDKEDLFMSDVEDFFEMMSNFLTRGKANPRRLAPVTEMCSHFAEMRDFIAALTEAGRITDVLLLGRGYFARSIAERLHNAGAGGDAAQLSIQAHVLSGSLFALVDWWLDHGMKTDPKEMDAIFHRMAWSGICK